MPYGDWDSGFQEAFENTPGTQDLESWEVSHVEALYETGFMQSWEEAEANGYSEDDIQAIREEFFDYLGIDAADFDWDGWREAMGYELNRPHGRAISVGGKRCTILIRLSLTGWNPSLESAGHARLTKLPAPARG